MVWYGRFHNIIQAFFTGTWGIYNCSGVNEAVLKKRLHNCQEYNAIMSLWRYNGVIIAPCVRWSWKSLRSWPRYASGSLTIIGPDSDLLHNRRQAIILGNIAIYLIGLLNFNVVLTNFHWGKLTWNAVKMATILSWPQWVNNCWDNIHTMHNKTPVG